MDTTAALAITGNGGELANYGATLAEMERRFLAFLQKDGATLATYTSAVKRLLSYFQGKGIARPSREDMVEYRAALVAEYKPRSVNLYLTGARLFFQWTETAGLYPNIAANIKSAKVNKGHSRDYFTAGQVCDILDTAAGETADALRDKAILSLMANTGLRCVEVMRADVGDLRTTGGDMVLYVQGKGDTEKTNYVKIVPDVERAIRAYLGTRGEVADNSPLFASNSHRNGGERLTTRSITRIVKGHFIKAGFNSSRLTAHSLRHTAAITNLLNGGTMTETQGLLRHVSPATTQIYTHNTERIRNNSEARIWAAYQAARN